MIHPTDECPQIAEHSFDLGSECKLPLLVDVGLVCHRPPVINAFVDAPSVRLERTARLDELIQELAGLRLPDALAGEDAHGDLLRTDLLGHDEGHALEVQLVHLHLAAKEGFQLR